MNVFVLFPNPTTSLTHTCKCLTMVLHLNILVLLVYLKGSSEMRELKAKNMQQ